MVYDVGPRVSKSHPERIGRGLKTMVRDIVANTDMSQSSWRLLGNDDQVLNIADPSLYPLTYGTTRVLPGDEGGVDLDHLWEKMGQGTRSIVVPHGSEAKPWRYPNRFQWLPCDVKFADSEGDDCRVNIESYINDLHPALHRPLYAIIEDVIAAPIQPWNDTVTYAVRGDGMWPYSWIIVGLGRASPRIRMFDLFDTVPLSPKGLCWCEEGSFFKELQDISDSRDTPAPAYQEGALQDVILRMERAEHVWVGGPDALGLDRYRQEIRDRLATFVHPDAGVLLSYDDWKSGVMPHRSIRPPDRSLSDEFSEDEDEAQPADFEWPSPGVNPAFDEKLRKCPHCPCWQSPAALLRLTRGKYARHEEANRKLDQYDHEYRQARLQRDFGSHGLQVYVRIPSVQLTPGRPRYDGGAWMLEGLLNEHIIASSVYFFDMENVTTDSASLSFRVQASLTSTCYASPGSEDRERLISIFAIDGLVPVDYYPPDDLIPYDDDPIIDYPTTDDRIPHFQELGSVSASEGKLVAFSNILQYRVGPVELRDPSKPGHIRFMTLCLADPNYRLVSTKRVVPQQFDWWMRETFPLDYLVRRGLPYELVCRIAEEARGQIIAPHEARELRNCISRQRERMMAELNSINYYLTFPDGVLDV